MQHTYDASKRPDKVDIHSNPMTKLSNIFCHRSVSLPKETWFIYDARKHSYGTTVLYTVTKVGPGQYQLKNADDTVLSTWRTPFAAAQHVSQNLDFLQPVKEKQA